MAGWLCLDLGGPPVEKDKQRKEKKQQFSNTELQKNEDSKKIAHRLTQAHRGHWARLAEVNLDQA